MFVRPTASYRICDDTIQAILKDDANPLNRIAEIIPDKSTVLDVGAGSGILARILKEKRPNVIIDGVEPNPFAAELARQYYRNFLVCGIEDLVEPIRILTYDIIVMADVIEHISDPFQALRGITAHLTEKQRLMISVPNIAFGATRIALLRGEFVYVDSGLLERTHLRFFTLDTLRQMVEGLELHVHALYRLRRHLWETEILVRRRDALWLLGMGGDLDLFTYQFLLVLAKGEASTKVTSFGPEMNVFTELFGILVRRNPRRICHRLPKQ
jgi:2-polyprenyl-3-methyl-5-hydroxy-6-metoxy-1,4-benzoquinol methylase